MAKKFLEDIDEVFGGDMLADVIPHRNSKSAAAQEKPKRSRKKSFLSGLDNKPVAKTRTTSGRKKSFLDAIEAALEDETFDDIIPGMQPKAETLRKPTQEEMKRLSMAIPLATMQKLKTLAKEKKTSLNELIRLALEHYMLNR